ncbi:MAG: polyphosphate kinase [Alphaproteobacteria bacterium]|nr:polyphosphate kinase [Alphaproteobacteria bacterium]
MTDETLTEVNPNAYIDLDNETEKKFRTRLIKLQEKIVGSKRPVIAVFCGVNGAGKDQVTELLREWLNNKYLILKAYDRSEMKNSMQEFRRYWVDTPPESKLGLFVSSWYSNPLSAYAHDECSEADFHAMLDRINFFEKTLADWGAIIVKFWLYMDKGEQEKYLNGISADPLESWRITSDDFANMELHDKFAEATQKIIKHTDKDYAKWHFIQEGNLTERIEKTLKELCSHLEDALEEKPSSKSKIELKELIKEKGNASAPRFEKTDLSLSLPKDEYNQRLIELRARLNRQFMQIKERGEKVITVFEGSDASGKGGAITRMTSALNIHDFNIFPISAPTKEEADHHFLWRFWKAFNQQKLLTVFDRSWYGRVLVERVEKFTPENDWLRGYGEINYFEDLLVKEKNHLIKFLLCISEEEQLKRFKKREKTAYKEWKITDEDWRNRSKWNEYVVAFDDMLALCDNWYAPWILVSGNNKRYARIQVMESLSNYLEKILSA